MEKTTPKLIDANDLRKELISFAKFSRDFLVAAKICDDAPAVDAVQVVRCKDCKYRKPCARRDGGFYRFPYDYCSHGIKMGAEEGANKDDKVD